MMMLKRRCRQQSLTRRAVVAGGMFMSIQESKIRPNNAHPNRNIMHKLCLTSSCQGSQHSRGIQMVAAKRQQENSSKSANKDGQKGRKKTAQKVRKRAENDEGKRKRSKISAKATVFFFGRLLVISQWPYEGKVVEMFKKSLF